MSHTVIEMNCPGCGACEKCQCATADGGGKKTCYANVCQFATGCFDAYVK